MKESPPTPVPATAADLAGLAALDRLAFPDAAWTAAQLGDQLRRHDGLALVIRQAGGAIRGACLGWSAGGVGEILRVAVHPDQRRRGLGRALVQAFIDRCRRRGADELWLELRADNAAALALYASEGFLPTGRRPRYYPDDTDALLLTWRASAP